MNKLLIFNIIPLIFLTDSVFAQESFDTTEFLSEKQEYIRQNIKDRHIQGMAIALFTNDEIIWKECFGESTYGNPINDSTLFSIQSMSKNFTALAVMFAVQDGLLDLDIPVNQYLPDFTINNCFEKEPEDKITLRLILNHTAGFAHEAPIGNNYDFRCESKQEHWNSISNTWLRYPVGIRYAYSNLGYDLAAEIIEKVSGMSFENYMRNKIFEPLEMIYSTVDDNEFLLNTNKTEGHINSFIKESHYKTPLTGSGAVYSNIDEMINYVQFMMNFGNINGEQLIERKYLEEMFTVYENNYGLGTYIGQYVNNEKSVKSYFLNHNGGGFGYGSSMTWFPEYGIGCVILGYRPADYGGITYKILSDFILENTNIRINKNLTGEYIPKFKENENKVNTWDFIDTIGDNHNNIDKTEIIGKYEVLVYRDIKLKWWPKILRFFGFEFMKLRVYLEQGNLIMRGDFGVHELKEYKKGLFFNSNGEVFDIRNKIPTFNNVKLRKYSRK